MDFPGSTTSVAEQTRPQPCSPLPSPPSRRVEKGNMMTFKVTHVQRNYDGTISGVGNRELGIRASDEVMLDIASGTEYEVDHPHMTARILVVEGMSGRYLRTKADESVENNLGSLPLL